MFYGLNLNWIKSLLGALKLKKVYLIGEISYKLLWKSQPILIRTFTQTNVLMFYKVLMKK